MINEEPNVHPSVPGKRTIAAQEFGLGMHVIGSKIAEKAPRTGKAIKAAGSLLGWAGVVKGFAVTTPGYLKQARAGVRKGRPARPSFQSTLPRCLPG
jgi:hypothetical protein